MYRKTESSIDNGQRWKDQEKAGDGRSKDGEILLEYSPFSLWIHEPTLLAIRHQGTKGFVMDVDSFRLAADTHRLEHDLSAAYKIR